VDEVREYFGYCESLADDALLVLDDDRIVGAAMRWSHDTALLVDPEVDATPVHDVVLPWFAERPGRVEVLSRDTVLRTRVEADGWQYYKSAFDLLMQVTPGLRLPVPEWPAGVRVTGLDPAHAAAVHRMIYVDAGWADIPGHPERDLADWRGLFLYEGVDLEQQLVAWRGERIVGAVLGRIWDDGTGWVSQLAVARDERRHGLGRALLHAALSNHVAAGATSLGLGVQAANESALRLYLDAGLQIDREWRTYAR
jgi:ribosomal protein S18 acetylase RimI-like enzyme